MKRRVTLPKGDPGTICSSQFIICRSWLFSSELFFKDRVCFCSPGCSRTYCVDHWAVRPRILKDHPPLLPECCGIKVCPAMPRSVWFQRSVQIGAPRGGSLIRNFPFGRNFRGLLDSIDGGTQARRMDCLSCMPIPVSCSGVRASPYWSLESTGEDLNHTSQ